MTLPIGKNKGFTLIEVLVAVAVLSLGLVMLYEAFFYYMDAYSYAYRRLDVQQWIDQKVWETENELICSGIIMPGELTGSFVRANKPFDWQMTIDLVGQLEESFLYQLVLSVSWQEISRDVTLSQVSYVQN